MTWGKDLEFGIPAIDDEHKRLMDLANRVYTMVKTVDDPKVLMAAFTELRSYAARHFADEEDFMARIGYPDAAEHRRQHQISSIAWTHWPRNTARERRSGGSM